MFHFSSIVFVTLFAAPLIVCWFGCISGVRGDLSLFLDDLENADADLHSKVGI